MALKLNSTGGGSVTLDAGSTSSNSTLTLPSTSGTLATTNGSNTTFTSITDSGNLTFTGTGNRITGDFSNATLSNRVLFQTSTASSPTVLGVVPNGAITSAGYLAWNDPTATNCAQFGVGLLNSGTEAQINSTRVGTGTFLPITFRTSDLERIRIDTSGNVGIGTSSPSSFGTGTTTLTVQGSSGDLGRIETKSASNTGFFQTDGSYTYIGTTSNIPVLFYQNNTQRMRIDSSGNLLVGTTATSAYLDGKVNCVGVSGTPSAGFKSIGNASQSTVFIWNAADSGTRALIGFVSNSSPSVVGTITSNGTNVAYNTSSDYRLKENIQPMQNALATVAQLKPVTYNWKADGSDGQGFIAHELQAVVPDCVTGEKDTVDEDGNPVYQGIDTSFLVATLAKAIQEQQEQINELKAEVAELKGV